MIWTLASLNDLRVIRQNGLDTGGSLMLMEGVRHWVSFMLTQLSGGIGSGFTIFFIIFCLRTVLRKDWIATIIGAFIMSFVFTGSRHLRNGR